VKVIRPFVQFLGTSAEQRSDDERSLLRTLRHLRKLPNGIAGLSHDRGGSLLPLPALAVDVLESAEGAAKDAITGIWNTMWVASGSAGLLLGAIVAHSYKQQLQLMIVYCFGCACVAAAMIFVKTCGKD